MTPESPLHRALAEWRAAAYRLDAVAADDPARPLLEAECDRLRRNYQALFEAVEDVAGHGALYVDADDGARGVDAGRTS
jgi:hypothetical protein